MVPAATLEPATSPIPILHTLILQDRIDRVTSLLSQSPELLDERAPSGWHAMHVAAACNNCYAIYILALGAPMLVHTPDERGSTPLNIAAIEGSKEAHALLKKLVN